ncbi:MAG: polysaccharide biosynthesis/export family protein [Muribaculaceae bacterium]|nr:polysaccharide biosynthesis/export family protein [Muribaculaceae bacterium]
MKKIIPIGCGLALLLATSCSTPKPSMGFFKDTREQAEGTLPLSDYSIKIKPDDELLITVTSTEPAASAPYNLPLSNPATRDAMVIQAQPRQQTFIVDKQGDIYFPILGVIHVEGLTTEQIKTTLTNRISVDVKDPIVRVELINFTVNVIGEVTKPGKLKVERERYSVLDALAEAGSLNEFGDRTNVLVVRENNGQAEYHYIDLTSSDITSSPYYYLQQNDVVMVSSTSTRESNSRYDTNNSYRVQVVSTIVSAVSVIASLVIALAVK